MKDLLSKILIALSIIILLGAAVFVFWPNLKVFFVTADTSIATTINDQQEDRKENAEEETEKENDEKEDKQAPITKGVLRRDSYLSRVREAKKLMSYDYYTLATVELLSAIKEKPNFLDSYLLLGEIYLRTNEPSKFNNLLVELKTRFPQSSGVAVLEIRKIIADGNFGEVLTRLELVEKPLSPEFNFYKAVLKALQNDHKTARQILRSLEILPIRKQQITLLKQDDKELIEEKISEGLAQKVRGLIIAYKDFDHGVEAKQPHLFVLLGKNLAQHNEGHLAREFADVAIKEAPAYIDAWIVRGYANLLLQDFDAALKDLRHAYELDPIRPQTHYFLALALYESGNEGEAALFFEKALENQFVFSEEIKWKLVNIFGKQKKYDQVISLYKGLLNKNTEEGKFTSAMHQLITLMKNPEAALNLTNSLLIEHPNDVFLLNMNSWALMASKDFDKSMSALKKAEILDPINPRTFLNFGVLYETKEEFKLAKNAYKKSYELAEKSGEDRILNLAAQKYNDLLSNVEFEEESTTKPAHAP